MRPGAAYWLACGGGGGLALRGREGEKEGAHVVSVGTLLALLLLASETGEAHRLSILLLLLLAVLTLTLLTVLPLALLTVLLMLLRLVISPLLLRDSLLRFGVLLSDGLEEVFGHFDGFVNHDLVGTAVRGEGRG